MLIASLTSGRISEIYLPKNANSTDNLDESKDCKGSPHQYVYEQCLRNSIRLYRNGCNCCM